MPRFDHVHATPAIWRHLLAACQAGQPWQARDCWASLRPHLGIFLAGVLGTAVAVAVVWRQCAPATLARADIVRLGDAAADPAALLGTAALARTVDAVGVGRLFPALMNDSDGRAAAIKALGQQLHGKSADQGSRLIISFRAADPAVARAVIAALVQPWPNPAQLAALPAPVPHRQRIDQFRARRADLAAGQIRLQTEAGGDSDRLTGLAGEIANLRQPVAADPDLAAARSQLNDLQLKRIALAGKYADGSPMLAAVDDQIRQLRALVADDAAEQPAAPDPAKPLLGEQIRLIGELADLRAQLRAQSGLIAALDRNLAAEAAAADRDAALNAAPSYVCRSVTSRLDPDWRGLLVPLVALGGLLAAAAAAWLAFTRRRVLCTALEVEACLGLPVMLFDQRRALGQEPPLLEHDRWRLHPSNRAVAERQRLPG